MHSGKRRSDTNALFQLAVLCFICCMSAMNDGFIDRTKLNFLPFISSDEPIPDIDYIKKELGHLTKSALDHFRPTERATNDSRRAPRKPRGCKRQAPEGENQSIDPVHLFNCDLLLDSDGAGGNTKGVAMFEDLLGARTGDVMLLCIPFVDSDGLFEKYRKFCEKQELIYSTYITCGYGSKENRQRKGANSSPGDHLQIPVIVKSNPDGLKILGGEIDWARALQSNLNPSLYVCFYNEYTAGPTEGATHNLCQIHYSDVLRGNLQLRHTQLRVANNPSSKFSSLFKGTTPTTFLSKSYHLLQQLLMEVRGDSQLTRLIILEFQKGYSTTETQLLKKKLKREERPRRQNHGSVSV
jgi:hypothetical protein